ncbi:DUF5133 domain-containing protein [Actinacidiphila epipremni]|jgi:hypothetical protein|uniref:DUF5133 domain-containing protein n=1 Tax=Actinacidiphila epipremni TaxID=2053013 RepID=A0ABX0ZLS9_9ACTN|nr:DUF5133 domain-containing protein [Actinacidiphila epipremni]NJP44241.1 DUF5133 domain-containing protein [Actinacidiphila epipremni]
MLMAHPTVLRNLVDRYEELSAEAGANPRAEEQLRDTAYTLCVSTGTREISAALSAARARIGEVEEAAA